MLETVFKSELKDFENMGILQYKAKGEKELDLCQFRLVDKINLEKPDAPLRYEVRCVFCNSLIATGDKKFLIMFINKMWDSILYFSPNKASCKNI